LLVFVIRRRPLVEAVLAAVILLPPLASTLWSYGRLSLPAFPLFIVLGEWAAARPRRAAAYYLPAAAGSILLMAYFGAWWWAG
jgi:hypothetical protein